MMEPKVKKKPISKKWWESAGTQLLKQYAEQYGGTYFPSKLKGWSYISEHVQVNDPTGHGSYTISFKSSGNSSSSSSSDMIEIKYTFRPRRKLEFFLISAKRAMFSFMHRDMRPVTMPDSAMSKLFKGMSTHPSLLRTVLKHDGLSDELMPYFSATIRLRINEHKATLSWTEAHKKPDLQVIHERMRIVQLFVQALREQNVIHEL
ncbi:hypothetical protein [Paenibacillus marinisediminis]